METKKISFGFMKTKKQEKPLATEHKEYIECVEEKSIKIVGGNELKDEIPLVIPMKPNTLITAERLKQIAEKVENFEEQPEIEESNYKCDVRPENETLEQMAARELLEETKKKSIADVPTLVVPVPAQPVLEGQKESTLDDYESVPIQDFGMAMLRGMGWAPGKDQSKYKQPQLRPKGLGLGADKVIKENQKKKSTKDNEEELSIVKKSYVKITTGKYAGFYGQVVSLDEENGRAMVDIPIKKETVNLSEFMMQPVTKSEYDKESKVINADSYEAYKRNENVEKPTKYRSKADNKDSSSSQRNSNDTKNKEYEDRLSNSKSRTLDKRNSPDRERHRNKSTRKYSSNESLNSTDSEYHKSKDRRRNSTSSESSSSHRHKKKSHSKSSKEKRDIDKKRKGKKKRRDRDRSPNYKKYRK